MKKLKYSRIRQTPAFVAAYTEIRSYLRRSSPAAYMELPGSMRIILDAIDAHPHCWPIRRKKIEGYDLVFHLAVVAIAYRKLHIRYFVDRDGIAYLAAVWVDGNDEPSYTL